MNKYEALTLLRGGKKGIKEWNSRRKAGEEIPDLTDTDLCYWNLSRVNLSEAKLNGTNLTSVNL